MPALRKQYCRKLPAASDGCRVLEAPGLEKLQKLPARAVIIKGPVLAHDIKQMVCRFIAPPLSVQHLGELHPRLVMIGIERQIAFQRHRIADFSGFLILRDLFQNELNARIFVELRR